ncbi:MAG TPA: SpoIIE family protein phosphatase, partial [Bacteroidia bacterium]
QSLKLREETHNSSGLALSYSSLAEHMLKKGRLNEAFDYSQKCLKISKDLGSPERIKDAALILKKIYEKQHKFKEALGMYQLYIQMKDSIFNEDTRKGAIKKGFQIEYEKQAAKDSIASDAKIKEEKLRHDLEINKQRSYTYGGLIGLGFMVLVAAVSFRAYRNKRRSNIIISRQKLEVEREKQIVEDQKHIIAEKNKEIVDSINYAKRLQDAILPPAEFIDKVLPNNFVLYLPKDIIAGDFYWCEEKAGKVFIAAADSTGHGVPGAMVSVVCSNALNRSLKEFHINDPGKILDKTRELVLETFEKSTKEVKDGMDISLLCMDIADKKIYWSGANNPLWYIQDNVLTEITANKQSIGKTDNPVSFTTHSIDYKDGSVFYLFTDGYADQFGGPGAHPNDGSAGRGKKFKYKQLSELLVANCNLPMHQQKENLEQKFTSWKGELEQVDDVCIIGIRL